MSTKTAKGGVNRVTEIHTQIYTGNLLLDAMPTREKEREMNEEMIEKLALSEEEEEQAREAGKAWAEMEAENFSERDDYDPSAVPDWTPGQWEGSFPARFDEAEDGGETLRDLYEREIDAAARAAWDSYHAAEAEARKEDFRVNVWFGAENVASVSEDFGTLEKALAFADRYTSREEYDGDTTILINMPACGAWRETGQQYDCWTRKYCGRCPYLPAERCSADTFCDGLSPGSSGCGYAY